MSKRSYRATDIKRVDTEMLAEGLSGRVLIGVDIAKDVQFAVVMSIDRTSVVTLKWSHPTETPLFWALSERLRATGLSVEVAMEPSGTYGDAIRAGLWDHGVPVFRVAGKRVHDAAEVYDGVNSMHDAKAAGLIARLHIDGGSEKWPMPSESERTLEATRQVVRMHEENRQRYLGRLEALMARHWPEVTEHLALGAVTLLELLAHHGGPARVAEHIEQARALMVKVGRNFLAAETVEAIVRSASTTVGVRMVEAEERQVRALAEEALRAHRMGREAENELVAQTRKDVAPEMCALVGASTSGMLVASGVDPRKYASPGAFEKALGLNLRERSSGTKKGGLHITKRGDGLARQLLYLAVLRLIQSDPVVRAWYRKKVERDGGKYKVRAVVAVMRKLAKALWHVARGAPFDATKLFDTAKLASCMSRPATEASA